jgi:hypothetical protein
MLSDDANPRAPRLEGLEPRLLLSAPQALLDADDITRGGDKARTFVVEYQSDAALNLDSLDGQDILVTGPAGYSQNARFMGVIDTGNPLAIRALYRIEAPGGRWDGPDNGTYDVALRAGQVANALTETNAAAALGSFNVDADEIGFGDGLSGDLGILAGFTLLTNLNQSQLATPRQVEFQMTGTGTADNFIQIDFAEDESAVAMTLFRRVNGKLVHVADASGFKAPAKNDQDAKSRRIKLNKLTAGTYVLQLTGGNPNFSLAINPATTLTPDLAAVALLAPNAPDTLIPGDTFNTKVTMTNIGNGKLSNSVIVDLYLSTDQTFDAGDVLVGTNAVRTFVAPFGYTRVFANRNQTSLAPGKSKTVTIKVTVPSNLVEGQYFLIAHVDGTELTPEPDELNNAIASAAAFDFTFGFGTFAQRRSAVLRYLDPDGTRVTFRLSGNGSGRIVFNSGVPSLVFDGTDNRTRVTITTSGGQKQWAFDDLTIDNSIASLVARTTELQGAVSVAGTIGKATFKNVKLP